ncbi:NUDIX domain-containing protein [Marinimicrobium sp. ABcell2]|uniref:NUDIX domain-containing protein n=1 Tax=Marinimicrobium sp. ABcell2 TaxID=3069751 RepID=UPI0027B0E878|nr:NUDIX domain-containing protein [Marinimicrobium sp. ABcell2]MDQ2076453.1 NUDIX domain-containing protein [Marinimicrobium sp. ABcell2]
MKKTDWKSPQLGSGDVEVTKRETLYEGFFRAEKVTLRHRKFDGGWAGPLSRELFLRGEAVGLLLYDPERDLLGLVEQFRAGALDEPGGPWCMEVVAGMVEAGESPEDVARREAVEESGVEPGRLEYICRYLPSPGGSNEIMYLYCGIADLSQAGGVHGLDEEHEDIKVHVLPAEPVLADLYGDRINNAAVLLCLQWLQINRPRLLAEQQS